MRIYRDNGIPYREWRLQQIRWQADALDRERATQPEDAPLSRKAIATPRDNYGWRSAAR